MITKTRILILTLVVAIAIAVAVISLINKTDKNNQPVGDKHDRSAELQVLQDESVEKANRRVRPEAPKYQSVDEAEQALLKFDFNSIFHGDSEDSKRPFHQLRKLCSEIPISYYSELTNRLGEGASDNLVRFFCQMALYQEWGRMDFDAALANLVGIKDDKIHEKALSNVFLGSAEVSMEAAMKKAETLEIEAPGGFDANKRSKLMDSIFDSWIESDPFSAIQWAEQASVPKQRRDQWIADGLRAWMKKDPDAAEKWNNQRN